MIRTNKLLISITCLLVLPLLATACGTAATPAPTEVPPTPTALELPTAVPATEAPAATTAPTTAAATTGGSELDGASLFQISCSSCHGQDLAGSKFTLDSQTIEVPALKWDDLSTTFQTQPARGTVQQQLALAITKGQDETGADLNAMMPHWSSLSQAQVDSLVQYMQAAATMSGGAPTLTPAATSLMGQPLYEAACAACHGADAAGLTFDKDNNKIQTPSIKWSDLTGMYTDPSRGTAAQQFAVSVTKGQDEKGEDLNAMMPRWTFLSQAQVDSLAQYIQASFP